MYDTTNKQLADESDETANAKVIEEYVSPTSPFIQSLADACVSSKEFAPEGTRALVVGSGAGRLPFLLSPNFGEVVAQDYCGKFVKTGERIAKEGGLTLPDGTSVAIPDGAVPDRIQFIQLTWLPVEIGLFDLVVVNLYLERALNARAWLVRFIGDILKPGGKLVIAASASEMAQVNEILGSRDLKRISLTELSPAPGDDNMASVTVWSQ